MNGQAEAPPAGAIRLAYLDALRGFAALYVVIFHVSLIPKPILEVPSWLQQFVGFGGSGVTLFFIISGFSMSLTWNHHVGSRNALRSFYLTRLFRIAPLFYAMLLFYLLRDFAFKGERGLHSPESVAANLLFVFNLSEPLQTGIVWASWTIGVEMVFYAFFPLVARIATSVPRSALLVAASLLLSFGLRSLAGESKSMLAALLSEHGFLTHLPTFLIGILVYHSQSVLIGRPRSNGVFRPLAASSLLVVALAGLAVTSATQTLTSYYASAACYGLLLFSFCIASRNPLVNRWTQGLGKISYSVYLNHPTLVYALMPIYALAYSPGMGSALSFASSVAVTLLLLIPISVLTYRTIEFPAMTLGKQVLSRAASTPSSASADKHVP